MNDAEHRIARLVLLAGSLRENPFETAARRSVLNLPVSRERSILDLWRELALELAHRLDRDRLPMLVVHGAKSIPPHVSHGQGILSVDIECDPVELRGPGGVMADIASRYPPDEYLLVASANQLPLLPVNRLADDIQSETADLLMWTQVDGAPITLLLVRCGALDLVPRVGFVDFKEQVLPKIAAEHKARISALETSRLLPILNFTDYLNALRHFYRAFAAATLSSKLGRWDDPWQSLFGFVEEGGIVGDDVTLCDSVILAGGKVDAGSVVIRSVVCPGGSVGEHSTVQERLVTQS